MFEQAYRTYQGSKLPFPNLNSRCLQTRLGFIFKFKLSIVGKYEFVTNKGKMYRVEKCKLTDSRLQDLVNQKHGPVNITINNTTQLLRPLWSINICQQ